MPGLRLLPFATLALHLTIGAVSALAASHTTVSIANGRWQINGQPTYRGTTAEGLLMNVRAVNAIFEDRNRPDFDAMANTGEFVAQIPGYVAHGVRAFTLNLQGGAPGYEGAVNSAFEADGSLRESYLTRVRRVIEACDDHGAVVILGCFYQRQDQILRDDNAVRAAVINTVKWIEREGFRNVVLELANEYGHRGYDRRGLKTHEGMAELLRLAKRAAPDLLVSTSETDSRGDFPAGYYEHVVPACDFLLIHLNQTPLDRVATRVAAISSSGKPIVCNEDDKYGEMAAAVADVCVEHGVSWGLMQQYANQSFPFGFGGAADDPVTFNRLRELTTLARSELPPRVVPHDGGYFPPAESQGGWRRLATPDEVRRVGEMDPKRLAQLGEWLLASDQRNFAAVVIRHGQIVLQVERGNDAATDSRRVASVSKAVCAAVLAIASDLSKTGVTPKRMSFDDPAFSFIPWAQPLSDPRKAKITIRQLLNHTSGICPEATGAPNDGTWDYVLGHSGDARTAQLAFDPGMGCGYSTLAFDHAALVCENVTGMGYDQFAIKHLLEPLGCEHGWFQFYAGSEKVGRHPSHGIGLPARDLARIAYCMLHGGRWNGQQVIPAWFVAETGTATHALFGAKEMRHPERNASQFSSGWERPGLDVPDRDPRTIGIPADARFKRGSGGQLIAFVPSLDLVVTRQTGASGAWEYEEFLRRACQAVLAPGEGQR